MEYIREKLSKIKPTATPRIERTPTAVALILRNGTDGPEILFIERASHESDPWSGNIGFPGGKLEKWDAGRQAAAERETMEELGIDLKQADCLGRLSDIVGAHLPVLVACFVYAVDGLFEIKMNGEVRDAFWVPLTALCDPARNVTAPVSFGGETLETPAIILPQPGKPVLWGLTYRLVTQFIEVVYQHPALAGKKAKTRRKPR